MTLQSKHQVAACWLLLVGMLFGCARLGIAQEKRPTKQRRERINQVLESVSHAESPKSSGQVTQNEAEAAATDAKAEAESSKDLPCLAVVGGQLHTLGPQGVIPDSVVIIRGDKIAQVGGRELAIPADAEQLDASGLVLTPGLIDARSELWLTDAAADSSASDASLHAKFGIDPFAEDWQEVISHGVTSVYIQPSRRGTLGGYGAVVSVAPNADQLPHIVLAPAALQASIGVGASNNRTRQQQFGRTKKVLDAAVEYKKKWDAYEAYQKNQAEEKSKKAAGEKTGPASESKGDALDAECIAPSSQSVRAGGRPQGSGPRGNAPAGRGGSRDGAERGNPTGEPAEAKSGDSQEKSSTDGKKIEKPVEKPDRDPAKELLVRVLDGKLPLRLELHSADDAHYGLQLLEQFNDLQVVFDGLSDLGSASAKTLALRNPLVLGPWLEAEPLFAADSKCRQVWGGELADYDGVICIATFGSHPRSSRLLRTHVAAAIAHGLSPERALRAVTLDAARTLGVGDQLGSIEPGKRADIACFLGAPTNSASRVALVVSGGRVAYSNPNLSPDAMAPAEQLATPELRSQLPAQYALKTTRCLLPNGEVEPRTIVVEGGRLLSLLNSDSLNEGAASVELGNVIDLGDALVTPGLFTAHATLGLERLIDPQSQPDSSDVVAGDCISSGFAGEKLRVQEGVLRALFAPGDTNPVAGSASLIRLGAKHLVASRRAAAKFVLTSNARDPERFPASLAGQKQLLRQSLSGDLIQSRVFVPASIAERMAAERADTLAAVASGKQPVLMVAQTDLEIRSALDLIEEYQLRAALAGARQLRPFLDRMRALQVTVIARSIGPQDFDWYPADLAHAAAQGVSVAFSGESGEELRRTASLAVEAGMSPAAALNGLCNTSLKFFGGDGFVEGAPADLIVWSTSPIDLGGRPLMVVVDGQLVFPEAE